MAKKTTKLDLDTRYEGDKHLANVVQNATRYTDAINETLVTLEALHESGAIQTLSWMADYKDALGEALRVLQLLHERKILQMGIAVLEQWDQVSTVLVDFISRPEMTTMIKNVLFMMESIGHIDPAALKLTTDLMSKTLSELENEMKSESKGGILQLFKLMRDPNIIGAMTAMAGALEGAGVAFRQEQALEAKKPVEAKGPRTGNTSRSPTVQQRKAAEAAKES